MSNPDGSATGAATKGAGYGKPPMSGQWKKGQSGNPKGRPKGALNLHTVVNKAAKEPVQLTVNGKPKKMPAVEAQVRATQMRGLQGKGPAEALILALYREHLPPPEEAPAQTISPDELAVLKNHLAFRELLSAVDLQPGPHPAKTKKPND